MSNDAILPFSRRKTKSRVIGLPGKLPETFVATMFFRPVQPQPVARTCAGTYQRFRAATRRCPPALLLCGLRLLRCHRAQSMRLARRGRGRSRRTGSVQWVWQMYRHGYPSTCCRFASVVTASKDGHVHTEWQERILCVPKTLSTLMR